MLRFVQGDLQIPCLENVEMAGLVIITFSTRKMRYPLETPLKILLQQRISFPLILENIKI